MTMVSEKNIQISTQEGGLVVGYLLAGYPTPEKFIEVLQDCNDIGLDIYEIGFPSTNPYADGEVICAAHNKVDKTLCSNIEYWQRIRCSTNKPIWLMAYRSDFIDTKKYLQFAQNKVMDAIVIPDMTWEQRLALSKELEPYGIDVLGFVNPSMSKEDMHHCFENFTLVYAQLHAGQTGAEVKNDTYHEMLNLSLEYEAVHAFAGFGINTRERVEKLLSEGFKGAIIGTSMIKKLNDSKEEFLDFVRELKDV
ncbi:tryptophan synthase subunit alpha [Oscillospiraceae bacterium PP1C4]